MMQIRATALAVAAALGLTVVSAPAVQASPEGHRNTAIVAGAVGIYGLVKKKPLIAGLGLGVAGYSYAKYEEARSKRKRHSRRSCYRRTVWRACR